MGDLKVCDREYRDLAKASTEFNQEAAANLESFRAELQKVLDTAAMEGNLATNLALFLDLTSSVAYGLEDLGPQAAAFAKDFISAINVADERLYL